MTKERRTDLRSDLVHLCTQSRPGKRKCGRNKKKIIKKKKKNNNKRIFNHGVTQLKNKF
jgi:hypothetical protein